jgi:lantibiotic modifying enzyme
VSEADVRATVEAIADHVLAAADPDRADRLWPADYRVFLTNPLSVAYGALGTALFLAAAGRELPAAVRRWIERQPLDGERYPPGLFVGLAGVAWALDRLGFPEPAARAIELAYASPLAHQGPDVFYGAAGLGLAALYFWGRTGEPRHLAAARRSADALTASAEAADAGPFWTNVDGVHYYGYAHGGSGIAYFFLQLHRATGEAAHLDFGRSALEHEISAARHRDDHAAWFRSAGDQLLSPYWRYGAAGIGSVLVRYAAALDDDRYRDLAARAARYAAAKYVVFPGQLVGLGGMGEFLLDMYRATGDLRYLGDAWRLAETALRFAVPRPPGVAFPGEELLRLATDFGTGSAGVGLFLLRLLTPGDRLFYDFAIPKGRA